MRAKADYNLQVNNQLTAGMPGSPSQSPSPRAGLQRARSHPIPSVGQESRLPEPRSAVFAQRTAEPRPPPAQVCGAAPGQVGPGGGRGRQRAPRAVATGRSTKVFLFRVPLLRSSGLRFRTTLIINDSLPARLVTIPEFLLLTPSPPARGIGVTPALLHSETYDEPAGAGGDQQDKLG